MRIVLSWFPIVALLLTAGHADERRGEEGEPPRANTSSHRSPSRGYPASEGARRLELVPDELDVQSALSLALRYNPSLAACSAEVRARDAAAAQAGALPNPELFGEMENFGGRSELRELDGAEITVGLAQSFELGGKRARRRAVAAGEKSLAEWDYRSRELEVLTSTSRAFIDVLAAQEQLSLNRELLEIAAKAASAVGEKVEAGKISPVENSRALIELAAARTDVAKASGELEAARLDLAGLWGAGAARFSRVVGELGRIDALPSEDSLRERMHGNPELARWDSEIERARATVSLARAESVPDLTISAGLRSFRETGDNAFTAGFSLPLPLFDRNRGGRGEAKALLDKKGFERAEAESALDAALSRTLHRLSAAHTEAISLRDEILPAATATYESVEYGYREGKFDFTALLDAQRTLFMIKNRYLASLVAYHRASVEMRRITGAVADAPSAPHGYSHESEEQ